MNLIKTSFYTSISTAITLLSGFIVTKVVAVKIGPEGMAYVGQFQNTTAIFGMLATGAIATGIIKYLAQYKDDPEKKASVIKTAGTIVFISSLFVSLLVMACSGYLSAIVFKTKEFWLVYFLFGAFTMLISFNLIFTAILNGLKELRTFTIINIVAALAGVIVTVIFAYSMGVTGVLLSSTATAAVIFILNIIVFKKMGIHWQPSLKGFDKEVLKKLSAFSLMAIASGFLVPLGQILVRDRIIQKLSLPEAGYWQAITRISDYYLGFITSVLGVYYLPRLSEIMNRAELKKEIIKGYKTILPVVAAIALSVWLLRGLVIRVLFTPVFLAMKPLFTFQLLGDFFKIGSWLLAYLLLARARIKTFIFTELIFVLSYILLSYLFIEVYGLIGTTYAFCINYAVYWIVIWIITRKQITPEMKE